MALPAQHIKLIYLHCAKNTSLRGNFKVSCLIEWRIGAKHDKALFALEIGLSNGSGLFINDFYSTLCMN